MRHWHYGYATDGYDPDGTDGFPTATEITGLGGLDDQLHDELLDAADRARDAAYSAGELANQQRKEGNDAAELEYLREFQQQVERVGSLSALATAFDPQRATAPLYKGNPALWEETVLRMVEENFPVRVQDNTCLYVWECSTGDECEHLED